MSGESKDPSDGCCGGSCPCPSDPDNVMESCIPLPLQEEIVKELVPNAKDYALLNGAGMRYRGRYNAEILEMAPFFLFPSSFPKRDFDFVTRLQPHVNLLMHKIAHDHDFLFHCLKRTIKVDDFTARLWNIYDIVRREGIAQDVSLGLLRSDVMMTHCDDPLHCNNRCDEPPYVIEYQVEINSIASGFGHMGPVSARIHKYVLSLLRKPDLIAKLPANEALEKLCGAMVYSWELYSVPSAVILFLVEDITYNICDQRFHEYEIRKQRPEVHVIRRTLTQISKNGKLTDDKKLVIDGMEVAVVYFRCGYEPGQYPTEGEWEARLMMERSKAIKCPSIYYHLAGAKKVQQEMARPGVLDKYLPPEVAKEVSGLFTGLYTLDKGEAGDKAIEMGIKNPDKYVLKPQREGGGNNVYGDEIRKVLTNIKDTDERDAYILMDRINPPTQKNYLVRPNEQASLEDVVSELGIFGVIIGSADNVLKNEYAGHMLRTKLSTVNEGGVAAGLGALDSLFLVD